MEKRSVLYVLSPGRSGSTLLSLLLATHPDIASAGELRYVLTRMKRPKDPNNLCLCGKLVPDCEFLSAVYEAGRRKLPFYMRDANYLEYRMNENRRLNRRLFRLARMAEYGHREGTLSDLMSLPFRRMCEANAAAIEFIVEANGGKVFLDGSKAPLQINFMKKSGLFDITLIHLKRDGRGRYHSLLKDPSKWSAESAATNTKIWLDRIAHILKTWPGDSISVRYEDLCERPLQEIRRVAAEASLDPDGMSLNFRESCPHGIGNRRVVSDETSEISNPETWRTDLSREQMEVFERIAGETNRSFGYTD